MTLAHILRVDAHLHRRLPADSELCQAIAVLARAHQDAIWRSLGGLELAARLGHNPVHALVNLRRRCGGDVR